MASVTGYFTLFLLCFSTVMGGLEVNENLDDVSKFLDFIKEAIMSGQIPLTGLGFNVEPPRVYINSMKIELTSFLKLNETRKDKVLVRTGVFMVRNKGNSVADAQSQSFLYKKTHTDTISIANTAGFSGALKLPFIDNFTPTLTFSNTKTTSISDTTEEWVTVQPQKVQLQAKSQKEVKYELYREKWEHVYSLDFTVDPSTTFTVVRTLRRRVGTFWENSEKKDKINLVEFLKTAYEKDRKFTGAPCIIYDHVTNKLMLKNYIVVRELVNDIVEVTFGEEEPLN
ncbi:uncharacterized protein LOC132255547 [Phlebotomus argentipes]|uniref:uncharacterized protein LOC132255547 n=1 Tax=Phlebotomus argentipes TaxID=94469 RepID=UPI0028937AFA|nr:uncharacterized protein LOC132255547 [Phlebotomus argentipes]